MHIMEVTKAIFGAEEKFVLLISNIPSAGSVLREADRARTLESKVHV
jgi:hypothetical protein